MVRTLQAVGTSYDGSSAPLARRRVGPAALLRPHPRELTKLVLVPAPSCRLVEHRVELRRVHRRHLVVNPLLAESLRDVEDRHPATLDQQEAHCTQRSANRLIKDPRQGRIGQLAWNRRQRSGTPLRSCSPASSKVKPLPATRSFTVCETRRTISALRARRRAGHSRARPPTARDRPMIEPWLAAGGSQRC